MIYNFIILIYFFINVGLAAIDKALISRGKRIYHAVNGLVYCALITPVWFITENWFMVTALLFLRLLVFNPALNLGRGLNFFYLPLKPKSIIDRIAKFVFGDGAKAYAFYVLCFAFLILKIFL